MLLLTRKMDETIVIGESVVVRVVSVNGGRVSLGIDAPLDIRIRRGELAAAPVVAVSSADPPTPWREGCSSA